MIFRTCLEFGTIWEKTEPFGEFFGTTLGKLLGIQEGIQDESDLGTILERISKAQERPKLFPMPSCHLGVILYMFANAYMLFVMLRMS